MIPFAPPRIDQEIIDEVIGVLKSGWITTGPKTKEFEKKITAFVGCEKTLCVSSATAGMELFLRWYGIGEGDEVILPSYTYCATANVVLHCGARPVMVDVTDDFCLDLKEVEKKITDKTKVIMPVDIGGWPCDYEGLMKLVNNSSVKEKFRGAGKWQEAMGRILVLSDSAHSFGANFKGKRAGSLADVSVFSFHAVKNLSTAEGGAICVVNKKLDPETVYKELNIWSLHGQSKDALSKTSSGSWAYDVLVPGYKCNMTDIQSAMGLVELNRYEKDGLPRRKKIAEMYARLLQDKTWCQRPVVASAERESSYHLYMVKIKDIDESARDKIMDLMFQYGVSVNVHFKPLPLLSAYKNLGYKMQDYPNAYRLFSQVISLPIYYDLKDEQVLEVVTSLEKAVRSLRGL